MNILDLFDHRDDLVTFQVTSDAAFERIVESFGHEIGWSGDNMTAPRRVWGAIQESADGAAKAIDVVSDSEITTNAPTGGKEAWAKKIPGQASAHSLEPVNFTPVSGVYGDRRGIVYDSPEVEEESVQTSKGQGGTVVDENEERGVESIRRKFETLKKKIEQAKQGASPEEAERLDEMYRQLEEGWKQNLAALGAAAALGVGGAAAMGGHNTASDTTGIVNPQQVVQQIKSGKIASTDQLVKAIGSAKNKSQVWAVLQQQAGMQGSSDSDAVIQSIAGVREGHVPPERFKPQPSKKDQKTLGKVADLMAGEKKKKKQGVAEGWGAEKQARDLEASNAKWRPYVEKYKDDPVMSDYFKYHRIYGGNTPEQAEQKALADAESGKKLPDWWTNPKPVGGYKLAEGSTDSKLPDIMQAFTIIGHSLHDENAKDEYKQFIANLRDRHGKEYATAVHKAASELHRNGRPESKGTTDSLTESTAAIGQLADAVVKSHPELFTEYGDEYVMSIIGKVAARLQKLGVELNSDAINAAVRAVVTRTKNSGTSLNESRRARIAAIMEEEDENKLVTAGEALDIIKDQGAEEPVVTPVSIKFSDDSDDDHKLEMIKKDGDRYVKIKDLRDRLKALRDASDREVSEGAKEEFAKQDTLTNLHKLGQQGKSQVGIGAYKKAALKHKTKGVIALDKERDLNKSGVTESESHLESGDPVIITGPVQLKGKRGAVVDLAPSGKFVIVAIEGHGNNSFHLSDVTYDDQREVDEAAPLHGAKIQETGSGNYDNEETNAVESAIIRRILAQHRDELIKYGPQRIMDAAREVAEYVGDVDEIGTSDVSAWTRRVLADLAGQSVDQETPEFHEGSDGPCWKGYEMYGMKEKNGKKVPNCVPLEETLHGDEFYESYGDIEETLEEAEYQGRKVTLNKPMQGDVKKFKVYVKDPKTGNVKKVNFGDPDMRIKKSNPERRKSFRARHHCDNPGPKTKARYWSCRKW